MKYFHILKFWALTALLLAAVPFAHAQPVTVRNDVPQFNWGFKFGTTNYEAVAAAGSTTSDAAALSAKIHVHRVTGADGVKGVKFASPGVGAFEFILNTTAAVLKIYPEAGGTINGGSADAAFSALTGIKPIICYCTAAATWVCS